MEVAVGVDRLDLIALAESEADLRLFAGMQFLTLIALLGLERYLWNRPCFGCQAWHIAPWRKRSLLHLSNLRAEAKSLA